MQEQIEENKTHQTKYSYLIENNKLVRHNQVIIYIENMNISIPCGLVVSIPGFDPGGSGSIPCMGTCYYWHRSGK